MENNKQKSEVGTITGIILVVIILTIGALYFFNQRIEKQKEFQNYLNQLQDNPYSTTTKIIDESGVSTTTSTSTNSSSTSQK
jgi:preprotein translocase subunit YajC